MEMLFVFFALLGAPITVVLMSSLTLIGIIIDKLKGIKRKKDVSTEGVIGFIFPCVSAPVGIVVYIGLLIGLGLGFITFTTLLCITGITLLLGALVLYCQH